MGLLKMRYLYQLLQNDHVESMLPSTFHLIQCISLIKAGQTTEKCHVIPSTLPLQTSKSFCPRRKMIQLNLISFVLLTNQIWTRRIVALNLFVLLKTVVIYRHYEIQ